MDGENILSHGRWGLACCVQGRRTSRAFEAQARRAPGTGKPRPGTHRARQAETAVPRASGKGRPGRNQAHKDPGHPGEDPGRVPAGANPGPPRPLPQGIGHECPRRGSEHRPQQAEDPLDLPGPGDFDQDERPQARQPDPRRPAESRPPCREPLRRHPHRVTARRRVASPNSRRITPPEMPPIPWTTAHWSESGPVRPSARSAIPPSLPTAPPRR